MEFSGFSEEERACIENADAKALATYGPAGLNVVPVSVVTLTSFAIQLYNFFMDKTVANLAANGEVSLTAWRGLHGVQVRGTAEYLTDGEAFAAAVSEMRARFPERTLAGVIHITPTTIFDVSVPGA